MEEELSPKEYLALCCLASGKTHREAASFAGVSESSIEKWKRKPEFQKLLKEAIVKTYEAALAELVAGSQEAAIELRRIITDPDVADKTKVSAINSLLNNCQRVKDWQLEERLERIEGRLNGINAS